MCDLASLSNSGLATGLIGLSGVVIGQWLGGREADKRALRDGLIEANKIVLVWQDLALSKLLFDFGTADESYLRMVADKCFEAQALLEVIGSSELNLAFGDLRSAVSALSLRILELKKAGQFNPKRGIEQFFQEPATEQYRSAKRTWINALRKESGVDPVRVPHPDAKVRPL